MDFFERSISRLFLVLTLDCNMECSYCYVNKKKEKMSIETAKKAIDLLFNAKGDNKTIVFFGGEPLLEKGLIKDTVVYSRKKSRESGKSLSLMVETNGIFLDDEILTFFEKNKVKVSVSFDGKFHDNFRKLKGGIPSSRHVESSLEKIKSYPFLMRELRVIITSAGDGLFDSVTSLHRKGFSKFRLNIVYEMMDDPKIENLRSEMKKISIYAETNRDISLAGEPPEENADFNCGISSSMLVRCDGTVVPCEAFINSANSMHVLGSINNGMEKTFFYDGKGSEKIPFCIYFSEKDGKPLTSREMRTLLKTRNAINSAMTILQPSV